MKTKVILPEEVYSEEGERAPDSGLMKYFLHTWLPLEEINIMHYIDANGNYQHDHYLAARELCRERRTAIDIGANIGLFSRCMVKDFAQVHCFEPVPIARACMARNVTANNYTSYPYALGSSEYESEIIYLNHTIGGSTIGKRGSDKKPPKNRDVVERRIKLQVKPLDSFNFTDVDFIKIDVQGYELEVLEGAVKTLKKNRPVILVELESDGEEHTEVPKFLNKLGYRLVQRIGKDGIFTSALKRFFAW